MAFGNSKCVPICDGITGVSGTLVINTQYKLDLTGIAIDTLVDIVSKFGDGDYFVEVEIWGWLLGAFRAIFWLNFGCFANGKDSKIGTDMWIPIVSSLKEILNCY